MEGIDIGVEYPLTKNPPLDRRIITSHPTYARYGTYYVLRTQL